MKWRVPVFLAVAAVAVLLENVLYVQLSSPAAPSAAEAESEDVEPVMGVDSPRAICADALRGYLAALPDLESTRSAFLTRAEAEALLSSGTPAHAGGERFLVLDGTLVNGERRVAWLDGIAVSEGDWLGDHELIQIEPRFVLLRKGIDQIRVELRPPPLEDYEL